MFDRELPLNTFQNAIQNDEKIKQLEIIKKGALETLSLNKKDTKIRKGEIAIEQGLAFPKEQRPEFRHPNCKINEIPRGGYFLVEIIYPNGKILHEYSSKYLNEAWVKGSPDEKEDGIYCIVAGEKL